MTKAGHDDERPPPVLGRWRRFYILEVVVLAALIALFTFVGEVYG